MSPQQTIAHYRILSKLGEGGMGAVYRATDTKLGREVAIKVLPDVFANDPDRLARFTREAQVLASLNHPNIAAIYGVEERAIVLELVEGQTLAGPLSEEEALPLIHQLIEALEYAHEKGIVHRDLKPANIKITPEGRLKVLDFGLAKALASEPTTADPASSPTMTMRASMAGVIMGTAGYMSPEQARGQNVDKRADIWAFGVVVCEMLTGRALFQGETISDTLAGVLTRDPDLGPVPPRFHRLLRLCLTRDPRQRLRDISGARLLLEEAPPARSAKSSLPWIAAGILAVAVTALSWALWRVPKPTADRPLIQLDLDAGPNEVLDPAISPDGSRVIFVSKGPNGSHLATRRLDQTVINALPGTERDMFPFFSPDGHSVGFFAEKKLKKIALDGGGPAILMEAGVAGGASWSDQGLIAAVPQLYLGSAIYELPVHGGAPRAIVPQGPDSGYNLGPQFLPRGKGLLFATWGGQTRGYAVHLLATGRSEPVVLVEDASAARYVETGHIVFHRQGKIFAAGFDLDRLHLTSEAIPMVDEVAVIEETPQFDVSLNGTLVYRKGLAMASRIVVRVDAAGQQERILTTPGLYFAPRLSPDGKQLAVVNGPEASRRILIYDFSRGAANRLTLDEREQTFPVWMPDGQHLIFRSVDEQHIVPNQAGLTVTGRSLMVRADGAGRPEFWSGDVPLWCNAVSRDGHLVAGSRLDPKTGQDIWIAPLEHSGGGVHLGKPVAIAADPANQMLPVFSPDGRWLAYMSNESGGFEIYVVSLTPAGQPAGGKWQISTDGGHDPVWPAAGGQIFYKDHEEHIQVVPYSVKGDSFIAGKPRMWTRQAVSRYPAPLFDVTPDGKQVIAVIDADADKPETHLRVLLNFSDEIRRRLAGRAK